VDVLKIAVEEMSQNLTMSTLVRVLFLVWRHIDTAIVLDSQIPLSSDKQDNFLELDGLQRRNSPFTGSPKCLLRLIQDCELARLNACPSDVRYLVACYAESVSLGSIDRLRNGIHLLLARVCGNVPYTNVSSRRVLDVDGGVIFGVLWTGVWHGAIPHQ
jgi:hypothetical protein